MRRMPWRAAFATIIGLSLAIGGVVTVQLGLVHRFESAQSSLTVHEGKPPTDVDQYTFFSARGDSESFVADNRDSILSSIRSVLLEQAEAEGAFDVYDVTAYVESDGIVAVTSDTPNFAAYGVQQSFTPWTPHTYMLAPFVGGLIMFAGLFWMAARWHREASIRRREIDETPL